MTKKYNEAFEDNTLFNLTEIFEKLENGEETLEEEKEKNLKKNGYKLLNE